MSERFEFRRGEGSLTAQIHEEAGELQIVASDPDSSVAISLPFGKDVRALYDWLDGQVDAMKDRINLVDGMIVLFRHRRSDQHRFMLQRADGLWRLTRLGTGEDSRLRDSTWSDAGVKALIADTPIAGINGPVYEVEDVIRP